MNRVLLIARREFLTNIKRRSFLFTAFGIPLIVMIAQFGIGAFVGQQTEATGTLGQIGYVDLSLEQVLSPAADKPDEFRAYADEASANAALMSDEIGAYFVVPTDYVAQGLVHAYTTANVPLGIMNQMKTFLTANLLADWPPERIERLQNPVNLTVSTLEGEKEFNDDSALGTILVPFVFSMLFTMSIFTTSGFLLQGVVEEKENRLVEILMTCVTPFQMLWGKILGLAALGFLQIMFWAAAGGIAFSQGDVLGLGDVSIPTPLLVWSLIYLPLGYLLYGGIMAGIGASVTSMQEGQQIASVASLIAMSPMIFGVSFLQNANGAFPTLTSLFPLTAPVAMMMRLPFADVPLWQMGLSILLLMLSVLLTVWVAAQVFRIGLLMYGKRLGLRTLWSALRQGLDIAPLDEEGAQ